MEKIGETEENWKTWKQLMKFGENWKNGEN